MNRYHLALSVFLALFLIVLHSSSAASQQGPLLATSLDDLQAVLTPASGTGAGALVVTNPPNDFVPAQVAQGLRIDGPAEYARFLQTDGTTQNVELDQGTLEFWYRPNYNRSDGLSHRIVGIGTANQPGSLALYKRTAAYGNDLYLYLRAANGQAFETLADPASFNWTAGQWLRLRLTWDSKVTTGVQSARLYLNGVELRYLRAAKGPFTMPAESTSQYIYLGSISDTETNTATGVLDEVAIYPQALAPQGVPTPVPGTATPTATAAVDNIPPQVTLTNPAAGSTLSYLIYARANATDNVSVAGVQFQVDGVNVGAEDTVSPYEVQVDTLTLADGNHTFSAIARDQAGNQATASAAVVVNNSSRPNIVFVLTDDERFDAMPYMPLTTSLLANDSVKFSNAFVSTSLCCPSRSSILTGLYAHNHGVYFTSPPNGGAVSFNDHSTIATWLRDSGYNTGLVGKYLNGYQLLSPYIPPGWSEWHSFVRDSSPEPYYNYQLNDNGVINSFGATPADYSTDVLAARSVQVIQTTPAGQPLFLYIAPFAPHYPYTPAPPDVGTFANLPNWRPPSYNESDVSDKPYWIQQLGLISPTTAAASDNDHRSIVESLQAVDRLVVSVIDALKATGRYQNTIFVFTSDNGLSWGEHRLLDDKVCIYEECSKVPLWMRVPGVAGRDESKLVENVDFAPTFAQYAGVPVPGKVDGTSMVNLIADSAASWRTEVLLENWGHFGAQTSTRGVHAVRSERYVYAEYNNGDRELYDLALDPYQMTNVVNDSSYAGVVASLQATLNILKNQ